MKRSVVVLALLAALTLTGCAGTVATTPSEAEDTVTTSTEETPEAAPATVAPTEPKETDAETWFLTETAIAKVELPDDEKLAAGYYACEEVAAGNLDVVVVEGLEPGLNEWIVADATATLCPELAQIVIDHQAQG